MSATRLSDVIIPEVYADYVVQKSAELSQFYQSGVATTDPIIAAKANSGGSFISLPYFNDWTGADESITDTTDLAVNSINAEEDLCVKIIRGNALGNVDLVSILAGANPLQAIGNRAAAYWAKKEQAAMISVLQGAFTGPLASSHVLDISGETGAAAKLSPAAVLDAKQLLGDNGQFLTAIVMHSAMHTALQKQQLIVYTPPSDANVGFETYLGYRIIVDDMMPVSGGTYTTYLLAQGALIHQELAIPNAIETQRLGTKSTDILISRAGFITHLRGVKWGVTTANPTNAQLATGANWTKVYDNKQIRAVALLSK